jgi:hypothetical protein
MDGTTTLINLLAGNGSLPPGNAAGDFMWFDGANWISKTVTVPFNFTAENISHDVLLNYVIPVKYLLKTITIENTTANPVSVIITTADTSKELMNEAIEANALLTLTLNIPFALLTSLHVSSGDWNGATINLSINIEKLF